MAETYLDHAATTPLRPAAIAAMVDVLQGDAGNPSGPHGPARRARRQLDDARDVIADVIGASPAEVVFTSGGTEADNLAIRGAGRSPGSTARHTHTGSDEARVASETSGDG